MRITLLDVGFLIVCLLIGLGSLKHAELQGLGLALSLSVFGFGFFMTKWLDTVKVGVSSSEEGKESMS